MLKRTLLAALVATASPLVAQDLDTVVATIDGGEITIAHMLDVKRQLPEQYRNLPDEVLFEGILEQLVQQRVLAASVAEAPGWIAAAQENVRNSLLAGQAISALSETEIDDAAIQARYDTQFADFEGAEEFNASHILVETEEEAQALVTELEGGADFATLAQERSTGPSGPRGGALGWFGAGMMVPAFEAAVAELEVGEVSPPVQTQFGWHVVKLNDTRTTEPPALEAVRDDIAGALRSEALEARMAELLAAAEIERGEGIDPSVLTDVALD
ncbi:MAG: peptidylprolyl isomerase [Shimia sp.]